VNEKLAGRHKLFIFASFCAYFLLAFPFTVQGSIAPVTMEYYGITATQQGLIMTMQSIGSLCTAVFIALKGERYNKIHVVALGLLIVCVIGAVVMGIPAYAVLLALIVVMGIGASFIDIMMNSVFTDVFPAQKNTVLPFVHGFYSIGAAVVPVIVTRLVDPAIPQTFSYPFRVLAILGALVFVLYFVSGRRIFRDTPYTNMDAMKRRVVENPAEIFKTGASWFFLLTGILYFTFQMGITIWLPTFAIQNIGADFKTGGTLLTAFYAGSIAMRFLGPLFLKKLKAHVFYAYFGGAAAVLMIAALFAGNITLMFVLVLVSGFLQGANVVALVLMCVETFPERTASAAAIYSIASGTAFLSAPVWMGALSEKTGFLFPMVLVCVALILSALLALIHGRIRR